jgi:hypothetical protein
MAPYALALTLVAASLFVGAALCRACGTDGALAPPVGLATLLALAALFVRLPGDAVTAAVALVLAVVGAATWLARGAVGRLDAAAPLAAAGSVALVSVQFLSAGRIGIPGPPVLDDTSVHLLWAEGLRSDLMARLYPPQPTYPLGPHALLATIAQGTGASTHDALVALLLATPALLAMTAAAALRPMLSLWRAPAAAFVGVTYLGAAWFAQGAFKEPIMSLYLLGYGMGLGLLLAPRARVAATSLVPMALLVAGSLLTYSYLAVAWLGAAAVIGVAITLWQRSPSRAAVRESARAAVLPVAIGAAVALLAVAVELPRLWRYVSSFSSSAAGGIGPGNLGNLVTKLPVGEILGIWPAGDFRSPPEPHWFLLELRAIALLITVGGALYLLERGRNVGLLAALGAALAVWLVSDRGQSPYVTAKSLVILSPFVALVGLRAVLPDTWPRGARARLATTARLALALAFVVGGVWSSQMVLRGMPVESTQQRDQLEAIREKLPRAPTLVFEPDEFVAYRLRDRPLGYFGIGTRAPLAVTARPEKPWKFGDPVDWDTVNAATLDRFTYVVTPRSAYSSEPPANFRLIAQTGMYAAYRRTGPTQQRSVLEPADAPVGRLECSTPAGRRLSRRSGVAEVWRRAPIMIRKDMPGLGLGAANVVGVKLPRGRWHLAARYTSEVPVRVMYGSTKIATLPPNTDRPGPWWPAGTIVADGHAQVVVTIAERESRFAGTVIPTAVAGIVAVSADGKRQLPLKRACGRYVDWYKAG